MNVKKLPLYLLVSVCITFLHCQKRLKKSTAVTQESGQVKSEPIMLPSPSNSVVQAKIVSYTSFIETGNQLCLTHPCFAKIHLLKIENYGSNFHGQFAVHDSIDVYFEYTLANTESLFPEFNYHNQGLSLNDTFSAELFESNSGLVTYKIKTYEKK